MLLTAPCGQLMQLAFLMEGTHIVGGNYQWLGYFEFLHWLLLMVLLVFHLACHSSTIRLGDPLGLSPCCHASRSVLRLVTGWTITVEFSRGFWSQ